MQQTRTRPVILLVEDYTESRQMLQLLLENLDYCVIPAANGREALAAAEANHLDLILTDFNLPDITGLNVVRGVRQLGNSAAEVPIIMLTAFDGSEFRKLVVEAGCNAFFNKPPDFDALEITIARLLKETNGREASEALK